MAGFLGGDKDAYYQENYFEPDLVKQLTRNLGSVAKQTSGQYNDFISNPGAHPLYQAQANALLQSMQPQYATEQRNLMDMLRASGNSASPTAGVAMNNLASRQRLDQQTGLSNLLGQSFSQIMQALQSPMNNIPNLIEALKYAQGRGVQMGGGGGGTVISGGGSSGFPTAEQSIQDAYSRWAQVQQGLAGLRPGETPTPSTGGATPANYDQLVRSLGLGSPEYQQGFSGAGISASFGPNGVGWNGSQRVGNEQYQMQYEPGQSEPWESIYAAEEW